MNTTYFYTQPDGKSLLLLVTYGGHLSVPGVSLKFNDIPFDLNRFKYVAPYWVVAAFVPSPGRNVMTSFSLWPIGYIYEFSPKANFGTIAGRYF